MANPNLTNSERDSYEKTITNLSKANSLTKMVIWLIAIIAAVGLVVTVKSANDAAKRAENDSAYRTELVQQIKDTADAQNKNVNAQLAVVNRHIDCVLAFFTVPNRTDLTITDIERCTLNVQGEVLQPDTSSKESVPLTPSQPQSKTQSNANQPTNGSAGTSTTPQTQTTQPVSVKATPNCKVDILFIHLGC